MKISLMNNILEESIFNKTVDIYKELVGTGEMEYEGKGKDGSLWQRMYHHRHWWFDYLHNNQILELAKRMFGQEIKPSYSFLSYYFMNDSCCPIHSDRPQCKYSVDMVIFQEKAWPIYIDFKKFEMNPNQATFYSGTDHIHWRDKIEQGNKVALAFFHFVDSDFKGDLN